MAVLKRDILKIKKCSFIDRDKGKLYVFRSLRTFHKMFAKQLGCISSTDFAIFPNMQIRSHDLFIHTYIQVAVLNLDMSKT